MDIPNIHDGTQAALRIEPAPGPAALVFTHAGMIGPTGCNVDGLAVVVKISMCFRHHAPGCRSLL